MKNYHRNPILPQTPPPKRTYDMNRNDFHPKSSFKKSKKSFEYLKTLVFNKPNISSSKEFFLASGRNF